MIFRSNTELQLRKRRRRTHPWHATTERTQLLFGQLHQLGVCLVDLSVCLLVTIACKRLLLVPKDSGSSSLQACDLPENLAGTVGPDLGMAATTVPCTCCLSLCTLAYRLCLLTQATCKFGEAKGTKGQANASKL